MLGGDAQKGGGVRSWDNVRFYLSAANIAGSFLRVRNVCCSVFAILGWGNSEGFHRSAALGPSVFYIQ